MTHAATVTPYYDHDGITIYHGDCREILPQISAGVLVTDPPYGIGYSSGHSGDVWEGGVYAGAADGSIAGDADTARLDGNSASSGTKETQQADVTRT